MELISLAQEGGATFLDFSAAGVLVIVFIKLITDLIRVIVPHKQLPTLDPTTQTGPHDVTPIILLDRVGRIESDIRDILDEEKETRRLSKNMEDQLCRVQDSLEKLLTLLRNGG